MSDNICLAIVAHPDDVEFMMAGTLARLKNMGWKIFYSTVANGDCGSAELDCEAIAVVRKQECINAAAMLGAEYRCAGLRDVRIFFNDENLMKVVEVIRWARPKIVLTQPPIDYMGDHEETSKLVRHACFAAPMPNYATGAENPLPIIDAVPHLYYTDPMGFTDIYGNPAQTGFVVDITKEIEIKGEMLKCHDSQRQWLLSHHGIDQYIIEMTRMAENRGRLTGVKYGEGFTQHLGHGYPQDNLLGSLLNAQAL